MIKAAQCTIRVEKQPIEVERLKVLTASFFLSRSSHVCAQCFGFDPSKTGTLNMLSFVLFIGDHHLRLRIVAQPLFNTTLGSILISGVV